MKLARLFSSAVALAASAAGVMAGFGPAVTAQATTSKPAAAGACRHVSGPFHRDQNKIIGAGGQRYIPYGISVTGLGNPNWKLHHAGDDAEIDAAAASWCANTVRLQIFQYGLLGPGKTGVTVNTTFLGLIEGEVTTALDAGLDVVINDQTEGGGNPKAVGMPTTQTEAFWKVMSRRYGSNPDVIFDLFNEPRRADFPTEAGRGSSGSTAATTTAITSSAWNLSRAISAPSGPGTSSGSRGRTPPGRWTRSSATRSPAPGRWSTRSTTRAGSTSGTTRPTGTPRFGYAAEKVPMTDAEWTNYSSTRSCWANAPTSVPAFLRYLARKGMGLTAWTLTPGVLAASADLADPTVIKSDWACTNSGLDEGAGAAIMNWFQQHNS